MVRLHPPLPNISIGEDMTGYRKIKKASKLCKSCWGLWIEDGWIHYRSTHKDEDIGDGEDSVLDAMASIFEAMDFTKAIPSFKHRCDNSKTCVCSCNTLDPSLQPKEELRNRTVDGMCDPCHHGWLEDAEQYVLSTVVPMPVGDALDNIIINTITGWNLDRMIPGTKHECEGDCPCVCNNQ